MLNKLQFNNLVVSNKAKIKQACAHVVQKLVQKIRKLKGYEADSKVKQRLRKTTELMEEVKKLKCFEVMQKVLLFDKNPSAVLTNGNALPENLAIAMLASNKIMQSLVKLFRHELKLHKTSSDIWKDDILAISKRRAKINRVEIKREKRLQMKEQKAIGRKRLEWMESNQQNGELEAQPPTLPLINTPAEESKCKIPPQTTEPILKRRPKNMEKPSSAQDKRKITTKTRVESVIKTEVEVASDHCEEKSCMLTADPFFVTDSGETYLATALDPVGSDVQDSSVDYSSTPLRRNAYTPSLKRPSVSSQRNDSMNRQKKISLMVNDDVDRLKDLHPSWIAKQKLKPTITAFLGKKIQFDES